MSVAMNCSQTSEPLVGVCKNCFCYIVLYASDEILHVPIFNAALAFFPLIYLMALLWKMDRATTKQSLSFVPTIQGSEMPPEVIGSNVVSFDEDDDLLIKMKSLPRNFLIKFFQLDKDCLPQYWVYLRFLNAMDLALIMGLFFAQLPCVFGYQVYWLTFRFFFRAVEVSVIVTMFQHFHCHRFRPRFLRFRWRPNLAISVIVSSVFLVVEMLWFFMCPGYTPQADYTFALRLDGYAPLCAARYWIARDSVQLLLFVLLLVQLIRAARRSAPTAVLSSGGYRLKSGFKWWHGFSAYPRRDLMPFVLLQALSRIFRLAADVCLMSEDITFIPQDKSSCLFAVAYFLEFSTIAPVLFRSLCRDSTHLWEMARAMNMQEKIMRGGTSQRSLLFDAVNVDKEISYKAIELGDIIGVGSFGKVHQGLWDGAVVAVKRIEVRNLMQKQSLLEEVALLHTLTHPNIIQYLGYCVDCPSRVTDDGQEVDEVWIVTELMSRQSLRHVLDHATSPLTIPQVITIALGIACGMQYIAKQRIVHRDLKSLNVFIGEGFTAKVGDFGSSSLSIVHGPNLPARSTSTEIPLVETVDSGTRLHGTLQWCSPEVLEQSVYSESSDVYSFGVVLWEILSLNIPWDGVSPARVRSLLSEGHTLPLDSQWPQSLRSLLKQCWQADPLHRPTFAQISQHLDSIKSVLAAIDEPGGLANALCQSASTNDLVALRCIIEDLGESPDAADYDSRTALHLAAVEGNLEVVEYLLEHGANINSTDRWGNTPLTEAMRQKRARVVQLLRKGGGQATSYQRASDLTGLLCAAASLGDLEQIRSLVESGGDPIRGDYDNRTPLHLAASEGHESVVIYLLGQGADPHSKDRWQQTPVDDARRYGHLAVADALTACRTRIDPSEQHGTARHACSPQSVHSDSQPVVNDQRSVFGQASQGLASSPARPSSNSFFSTTAGRTDYQKLS